MIDILERLNKNKKQAMIFFIAAFVIVVILYFYILLLPQIMALTDILGQTGKRVFELKEAQAAVSNIDNLKKAVKVYNEKIDIYEKRLPAENEIPTLLESLSIMARDSNVKIIGITPVTLFGDQKKPRGRIYQEFPIQVSAKAGYHELGCFLGRLENADRFMKVIDININADAATPKKHDVELVVATYILLKEAGKTR
ncbi:MAG: type 4a pilus biogenesis protein PilO [Candidatus Omnitrophica bacterium]|nr:type 4a pilus biogenesis protein PilO [Candidatus Omnitrophota bacterium]